MNKIKVFLSSRVQPVFQGLDRDFALTDLRKYLRETLESEEFLGEKILEVIMNESSFKSDFTKDAFDNCLKTMRSCNVIIVLYNGEAGWSAEDMPTNGIVHEEFLIAMNDFSGMTWGLDLTKYFKLPADGPEKRWKRSRMKCLHKSRGTCWKRLSALLKPGKRRCLGQAFSASPSIGRN
ncbi:MAG: DUF4062 domain-containing protein [Bacteroidetes bacterium]|nr:DUF4062 domain-containing protein [Bacteroidota bacterium]